MKTNKTALERAEALKYFGHRKEAARVLKEARKRTKGARRSKNAKH